MLKRILISVLALEQCVEIWWLVTGRVAPSARTEVWLRAVVTIALIGWVYVDAVFLRPKERT